MSLKKQYLFPEEAGFVDRRVDFGKCHETWKTSAIELQPVSTDNWIVYVVVAIVACSINIKFLIWSIWDLYQWSLDTKNVTRNWLSGPGKSDKK